MAASTYKRPLSVNTAATVQHSRKNVPTTAASVIRSSGQQARVPAARDGAHSGSPVTVGHASTSSLATRLQSIEAPVDDVADPLADVNDVDALLSCARLLSGSGGSVDAFRPATSGPGSSSQPRSNGAPLSASQPAATATTSSFGLASAAADSSRSGFESLRALFRSSLLHQAGVSGSRASPDGFVWHTPEPEPFPSSAPVDTAQAAELGLLLKQASASPMQHADAERTVELLNAISGGQAPTLHAAGVHPNLLTLLIEHNPPIAAASLCAVLRCCSHAESDSYLRVVVEAEVGLNCMETVSMATQRRLKVQLARRAASASAATTAGEVAIEVLLLPPDFIRQYIFRLLDHCASIGGSSAGSCASTTTATIGPQHSQLLQSTLPKQQSFFASISSAAASSTSANAAAAGGGDMSRSPSSPSSSGAAAAAAAAGASKLGADRERERHSQTYLQTRMVRLVCVFVQSLLRNGILTSPPPPITAITPSLGPAAATSTATASASRSSLSTERNPGVPIAVVGEAADDGDDADPLSTPFGPLLVQLQSFCIEFARVKEATQLFKMLKSMT